ncbi:MAG: phosphoribosylglycinamide formyltransferase [Pseudomonadota bacterium]
MRVGILISGRGSNMIALAEAAQRSDFPVDVALVLSNDLQAAGLQAADAIGIKTQVIEHKPFGKDREAFERAVDQALKEAGVELVCLAGFMRLLTPWFVQEWRDRLINIHPSLLPAFKGLDTHARALEAGVKLHGCTVHFVRPEMDDGPILGQMAVPVLDDDTPETLGARVLDAEHKLYPKILRQLAEGLPTGAIRIKGNRVMGMAPAP